MVGISALRAMLACFDTVVWVTGLTFSRTQLQLLPRLFSLEPSLSWIESGKKLN